MANGKTSSPQPSPDYRVNLFRPRAGLMRQRVLYMWVLLASWAFFTFGFQALLALIQRDELGQSSLTDLVIFGFPFHYWFTGQFLMVWFILLCLLFNLFIDRLLRRHGRQR